MLTTSSSCLALFLGVPSLSKREIESLTREIFLLLDVFDLAVLLPLPTRNLFKIFAYF